eukprot:737680-Pleurochrysis_carterae.AAC.1
MSPLRWSSLAPRLPIASDRERRHSVRKRKAKDASPSSTQTPRPTRIWTLPSATCCSRPMLSPARSTSVPRCAYV